MSSCGCSSSYTPTFTGSSSAGLGCGSSDCRMPRRVANPPTTPVRFTWVASMRQTGSGQLVVRDCTGNELGVLDSPISGQVLFDGPSGTAYVGTTAVSEVQDNFACSSREQYFGLPVYALQPDCRSIGENPDRQLAIMRPQNSQQGQLTGILKTCPTSPGLLPEMTPVNIKPEDFPVTTPTGVKLLAAQMIPAQDDCTPATVKWWWSDGRNILPADELLTFELPNRALTAADDEDFSFAFYARGDDGTWRLFRLTNESFQTYINTVSSNYSNWLNPPSTIVSQVSSGGLTQSYAIDLTTQPGYSALAKSVMLRAFLNLTTGTQSYSVAVVVNGIDKAASLVDGSDQASNDVQEVTCEIPANKILNITLQKTVFAGGSGPAGNTTSINIRLEHFFS